MHLTQNINIIFHLLIFHSIIKVFLHCIFIHVYGRNMVTVTHNYVGPATITSISTSPPPSPRYLHQPTLHFMHKWLGFSLFPRNNFRIVRNDELKLVYAMVKRKKVSPVKFMMAQWVEIPGLKGDVGCTSLVTRIARTLCLLANSSITYIHSP